MELDITYKDGSTSPVVVYYVARGLAVQRAPGYSLEPPAWGVLHIASGQRIGGELPTRTQARRLQQALLALPVDWTQDVSEESQAQVGPLAGPIVAAFLGTAPDEDGTYS